MSSAPLRAYPNASGRDVKSTHNPYNLNVRLIREELMQVCDTLAQKLNQFKRGIAFVIPTRGWSVLDVEGGELYEPGSNKLFVERLKQQLGRNVAIEELGTDINDPRFAELAVKLYLELSG
ncbi:MAG: Tm-1-like ATP-binding domain-containing protein [Aigarchaeota archaeon]|nr:Tm-1-like ATP-binding domain-containing protein [Candidatus Pelearchaeum maunauluense]